jgi:hypothetical protein
MRGKVIAVGLLMCAIALPVCAQRRGLGSSPRGGGSVAVRSTPGAFGFHGGVSARGGAAFRGGVSFGNNRGVHVIVNPRPFYHPRRWSTYPYRYSAAYVYPYVVYPVSPLSYYNTYDYAAVAAQPSYATYEYGYATGSGDVPEMGLAEQMRQQNVGIYRKYPYSTEPSVATTAQPAPAPEPERPPTVLVYRDGQRAEIGNYAVVGQTLWIFSEDRAKKVPLAQLDLDATRKANDERGVEFAVPAVR